MMQSKRQVDVPAGKLDGTDVLVCYAAMPLFSAGILSALTRHLDSGELQRANRFVREMDRDLFVTSRALLRHALRPITGERHLSFVAGKYGKPELADPTAGPGVKFNVTHTAGLVACAISLLYDVGVDAEAVDRPTDYSSIADRCLSGPERQYLAVCPPKAQAEAFCRMWTLKEAIAKAIGEGLSISLTDIAVDLQSLSVSFAPSLSQVDDWWHIEEYQPTSRHTLAVAVRRPPYMSLAVRWQSIDVNSL
jgi:4'-phosphopantetheinyl transferase